MLRACLVLLVGLGAPACNSDDLSGMAGSPGTSTGEPTTTGDLSSSSSSTGAPTTTGGESSSSSGDPTTGEPPPPEQTCRDVLMCVSACALSLDLECFQACAGNLPPEEGVKALELGACIIQGCFGTGACSPETLQDPLCLACIGFGLLSDSTPGCEEQSAACK